MKVLAWIAVNLAAWSMFALVIVGRLLALFLPLILTLAVVYLICQ